MPVESTRTDRGYVVVTRLADETYEVEICQSVSAGGRPENVYARHLGVPVVEIRTRRQLMAEGLVQYSANVVDVFIDADTGALCIADVEGLAELTGA